MCSLTLALLDEKKAHYLGLCKPNSFIFNSDFNLKFSSIGCFVYYDFALFHEY